MENQEPASWKVVSNCINNEEKMEENVERGHPGFPRKRDKSKQGHNMEQDVG